MMNLEVIAWVLESVIVIELFVIAIAVVKKRKQQPKDQKLAATELMVKKIRLNNKWDSIDDVIGTLEQDSIHINFRLR